MAAKMHLKVEITFCNFSPLRFSLKHISKTNKDSEKVQWKNL
jgi:hypothetical protein